MKKLLHCLIFALIPMGIFAQNTDTTKISAKPLFLIYSNFHKGISEAAHESNFDVRRAYLGYDFDLNNGFSGYIKIDIGSPDDISQYSLIRRSAYLRSVGVNYKKNKLSVDFGIIDNLQHKMQEKFWGKRYLFKSFIDEYRLFSSTDLGFTAQYNLNKKICIEFSMMNGEYLSYQTGFKKYIYSLGLNYVPTNNISLKTYTAYSGKIDNLWISGIFLGIKPINNLKIGGEFNIKQDIKELVNFLSFGYSAFTVYDISQKWNCFLRYDNFNSNIPINYSYPWNLSKNGSAIIGGVEYIFNNNVRMSLNYQDWYPMAANMSNKAYIYLNLEFGIYESHKRI